MTVCRWMIRLAAAAAIASAVHALVLTEKAGRQGVLASHHVDSATHGE